MTSLGRARRDQPAARLAALRTEVDDPVGRADHVEVVLDDDQRMPGVEQAAERAEQLRDVVEVQAGRRLVEQEQRRAFRLALGRFGEVTGELQALRLAARERRHRLTEPQVVEADRDQRLEAAQHVAVAGEERGGLGHRHVEHVGDAARGPATAHHLHLEGLGAVAASVAVGAAQVHVREELHLDVLEAVARAGRAAPGARVEAERAGRVAALDRHGSAAKRLRIDVEGADVARWIRARGAADRRLVDHHDLGDVLRAEQCAMRARRLGRLALRAQQRRRRARPAPASTCRSRTRP